MVPGAAGDTVEGAELHAIGDSRASVPLPPGAAMIPPTGVGAPVGVGRCPSAGPRLASEVVLHGPLGGSRLKILCTADIHIGRRSSRLPLSEDSHQHSCAQAWTRVVDTALAEHVDVVLVAGDLIDQANRYFEAYGAVARGFQSLSDAGIDTFLVAGNHDFDVLPRIVGDLATDRVRLLGRGGSWERATIERRGVRLHVDGWSFPAGRYPDSPVRGYAPAAADAAPVIALVHGDLDQPGSAYAPCRLAELARHPSTFFVFGHVHAAREIAGPGGLCGVYPGSPQAMDPGENGAHGVHLLELGSSPVGIVARPLSTVRYERLAVDLSGVTHPEEVPGRIAAGVRERLEEVSGGEPHLRHLRCRVVLTGTTVVHRELERRPAEEVAELLIHTGRCVATVERVEVATRPHRDLAALSEGAGPPAVLARLLRELEAGPQSPGTEQLLGDAVRAVREVQRAVSYAGLDAELEPSRLQAEVMRDVRRSASLLLEELLAQKEPVDG